ncbi:hypothetical protein GCM10009564_53280 [Streptomyces thermogriseus]|uniref:Uncharacterized protein n=1 Tax=Streptomyces thermogriseus TaxID=75292 RepID=A0ABN1T7Y7_9ACTN
MVCPRLNGGTAAVGLPPLDELKARTARPAIPEFRHRENDAEFLAWAEARVGADPAHLAELLDAVDNFSDGDAAA